MYWKNLMQIACIELQCGFKVSLRMRWTIVLKSNNVNSFSIFQVNIWTPIYTPLMIAWKILNLAWLLDTDNRFLQVYQQLSAVDAQKISSHVISQRKVQWKSCLDSLR